MSEPLEVELPRDPAAAGSAGSGLDAEELGRAKLLVSELVNNAVLHGQGAIMLRLSLDQDRLLAEVIDQGTGFERVVRKSDFERLGGWGLSLVEAESTRWGVHEGTTHVWFEIERPGPRLGPDKTPLAGGGA